MTQMDLLEARCRVPENKFGQLYELLLAFERGEKLTVKLAMDRYGCYALSQRVGNLKNDYGWPIKRKMIEVRTGTWVAEYWLER